MTVNDPDQSFDSNAQQKHAIISPTLKCQAAPPGETPRSQQWCQSIDDRQVPFTCLARA